MTGYTVNTGATTKFSEGWDRVFGGSAARPTKKAAATSRAKAASKAPEAPAKAVAKTAAPKARTAKTVKSKKASQTALTSGKR